MELINCKKCGTLFRKKLRNICDNCILDEKNQLEKITKFMNTCKDEFVSMELISQKTKITAETLEDLYKNGRLSSFINRITTKCKICGTETKMLNKKGHFCVKCIQGMIEESGTRTPVDISKNKVELRKFDKNIMHTNKILPAEERTKFGFKKSMDP